MKTQTTIILLVLVIGLGLFIFLFERKLPTTDKLEERKEKIFKEFDRDKIDEFGISYDKTEIVLIKKKGEDDEEHKWIMQKPIKTKGDSIEIDAVLSALEWLEIKRQVKGEDIVSRGEYGLIKPRLIAYYRMGKKRVEFSLGNEAPGDCIYLALKGEKNRIYVVEKHIYEELKKTSFDLRDKKIVELEVSDTVGLSVKNRAEYILKDKEWYLLSPYNIRVDKNKIESIIRALNDMKAKKFVDNYNEDLLKEFKLNPPLHEVKIKEEHHGELTLKFGDKCKEVESSVYVLNEKEKIVACVEQSVIDSFNKDLKEYFDLTPIHLSEEEISKIEFVSEDNKKFTLVKKEGDWLIEGEKDKKAYKETINQFIERLNNIKGEVVELIEDDSKLKAVGLLPPMLTIAIYRAADNKKEEISIGRVSSSLTQDSLIYLRRNNEGGVLGVKYKELEEYISESPLLVFKDKKIIDEESENAVALKIYGSIISQELKKENQIWKIIKPVTGEADEIDVNDTIRSISQLTVERFVDVIPEKTGFNNPYLNIEVLYKDEEKKKERVYEIIIGNEVEKESGTRYATLKGSNIVFILSKSFIQQFTKPLLNRSLFVVEEDNVKEFIIIKDNIEKRFTKKGESWEENTKNLLDKFSSLRASKVVAFNGRESDYGFNHPLVTLKFILKENKEKTILIGEKYESTLENIKGYYAMLKEAAGIFILGDDVVDEINKLFQ